MTRAECRSKYFDGSEMPRMCMIVSLTTRGNLGRSITSILRFGESISAEFDESGRAERNVESKNMSRRGDYRYYKSEARLVFGTDPGPGEVGRSITMTPR